MPIKLAHKPMSGKRMNSIVRDEVRKALRQLGDDSVTQLQTDVKDWEHQPKFSSKATVSDKKWQLEVKVNRREKAGKIYNWVDQGTAARGNVPGQPYPIVPKKKNKKGMLEFWMPHSPKTMPNPEIPGFPSNEPLHLVRTPAVMHPGIYPRNFTTVLKDKLKSGKPGSFRNVVEAAVKRALRKISKQA